MSKPVIALVPAAGRGERFGENNPKSLYKIDGRSILRRTLDTIALVPQISTVLVLCPADYKTIFINETSHLGKKIIITEGGQARQDSIRIGLSYLKQNNIISDDHIVVIHDAARCQASPALFDRIIVAAELYGAVTCAIPVIDSLVIQGKNGVVGQYLDRSKHCLIQTPQAFKFSIINQAHEKAYKSGNFSYTDDASLLQGEHPVYIIEGESRNFKITHKSDLNLINL